MPGPFDKHDNECDDCGKPLTKVAVTLADSNSKFCSEACAAPYRCDKPVNGALCGLALSHAGECKGWSRKAPDSEPVADNKAPE